jgi:hypothetical protein
MYKSPGTDEILAKMIQAGLKQYGLIFIDTLILFKIRKKNSNYQGISLLSDRLCGLVVRVLDYRSGGSGSIPGTNKKKISGSGTGSTQPREYN